MSNTNINACIDLFLSLKPEPAPSWASRAGQAALRKERGLMRGQDPEPAPVPAKKEKVIRVRLGRLAGLMDMPLDIFYEIIAKLHPSDLLRLARASKHLRSMLMTKRARHLWVASFRNVPPGLPQCPPFIPEPRYAAVLFDQYCFACGIERSTNVDYGHFLRLCAPCYKRNFPRHMRIGSSLRTGKYSSKLAPLLVAVVYYNPHAPGKKDSINNSAYNTFFQPEVEAVNKEWLIVRKTDRRQAFLEERQAYASMMQQHAWAVSKWDSETYKQKRVDQDAARNDRKTAMLEKLNSLGYTPADYPDNAAWKKILEQPTRLTDRIWKTARPKLEALIRQKRRDDRQAAYEERLKERRDEFKPLYDAFVQNVLTGDDRSFAPSWHDACLLPCIVELTGQRDALETVTQERVTPLHTRLIAEVHEYTCRAKRDLIEMLHRLEHGRQPAVPPIADLGMQEVEAELAKGSSLFICHRCPLKTALSAPDICTHWRAEHATLKWNKAWPIDESFDRRRKRSEWPELLPWVCAMPGGAKRAREALAALGLPEDSPHTRLDNLVRTGRLVCRCGSPKLPPPGESSWAILLHHVTKEISWHSDMSSSLPAFRGPCSSLLDNHTLSGGVPCLQILAEGEQATFPDFSVSETVRAEVSALLEAKREPPICLTCYYAVREGSRFIGHLVYMEKDVDVLAHHMKTRHDKTLTTDMLRFEYLY
ncbi:hypothetical protein FKP32DRAFT_1598079 [Trametes sanguinea]|nr:hypothetical protein FKP32DRAFT_1598079 [Trametes sanguinea]